ncbi:hypothetical protein M8C21_003698 [Ambrosia artemisiifolia]|uniref:Uncharacterized protein n=1 Tax=Ambrosia artemisiifolia TaxID=4212 RepID=A0AAD5CFD7_AMBAR|nr:hypothetical protein M8C21_003698 [Ambrosia artemisiifolia]
MFFAITVMSIVLRQLQVLILGCFMFLVSSMARKVHMNLCIGHSGKHFELRIVYKSLSRL